MDISQNNLSGPIPGCLSNITFEIASDKSLLSTDCIGSSPTVEGLFSYAEGKKLTDMEQHVNVEKYPLLDVQQEVEFSTKSRSYTYKGDILNFMSGIDLPCNQLSDTIPSELGNLSEVHALNLSHNMSGSIPTTFSSLRKMESLDLSYNYLNGRIPPQLIELNSLAVFSVAHNNLSGEIPEQKAQFATFEASSYEVWTSFI
ncbi:unnamed protein product [Ilex paraguariensis]|uniref:Uncharacterized protein n=1 Tax=Ilex paraguariensis TaxID=185542 RepID=A0ABC8SPA3_9AQUA